MSTEVSLLQPTPLPAWSRPRTPLTPHRLAKLANALGVSTPIPAHSIPHLLPSKPPSVAKSPSPVPSRYSPGAVEPHRHSPTPSTVSAFSNLSSTLPPSTSKFLLHVIPPLHLPHDSDDSPPDDLTPVPSRASGYHTQFRRGTLVPVYPTLQGQLGAIAKEYALPSTVGMILYLVQSQPQSSQSSPTLSHHSQASFQSIGFDEPGPRLSEDIWRHLWARVVQVERDESRSLTTGMFAGQLRPLTSGATSHSHLPNLTHGHANRHQSSPSTSPSTPSPSSEAHSQTSQMMRFADLSSSSLSQSEPPDTPATSQGDGESLSSDAGMLELPGLASPSSFVPILAKVEFDVDRRKAGWYDKWVRSRRSNRAKRVESQSRSQSRGITEDGEGKRGRERIDLKLVERMNVPRFLRGDNKVEVEEGEEVIREEPILVEDEFESDEGYTRLSESPESIALEDEPEYSLLPEPEDEHMLDPEHTPLPDPSDETFVSEGQALFGEDEDEDDFEEDGERTARLPPPPQDPLADIFGTDEEAWNELHAEAAAFKRPPSNPNIVELDLTGADLSREMSSSLDDTFNSTQTEETEVRDLLRAMTSQAPAPRPVSVSELSESSASLTSSPRKHVPTPLILQSPASSTKSALQENVLEFVDKSKLPYLKVAEESSTENSPDFDWKAFMKAAEKREGTIYDELDLGLEDTESYEDGAFDENDPDDRRTSQYLMRSQLDEIEKNLQNLSPRKLASEEYEAMLDSPGFRIATNSSPDTPHSAQSSYSDYPDETPTTGNRLTDMFPPVPSTLPDPSDIATSWPAVPFSKAALVNGAPNGNNGIPRMALNGLSGIPESMVLPPSMPTAYGQSESEIRKRQLEEDYLLDLIPSRPAPSVPVSPISPADSHFSAGSNGTTRFSSEQHILVPERLSAANSRFSADSTNGEFPASATADVKRNRSTMKTIKNLWRKSLARGSSQPTSPSSPPPMPFNPAVTQRPQLEVRTSMQSSRALSPTFGPQVRAQSPMQNMKFDQESPYPVRRPLTPGGVPPGWNDTSPPPPMPTIPAAEKEKVVRKSILKGWKSPPLTSSTMPSEAGGSTDNGRNSAVLTKSRRTESISRTLPARTTSLRAGSVDLRPGSSQSNRRPSITSIDSFSQPPVPGRRPSAASIVDFLPSHSSRPSLDVLSQFGPASISRNPSTGSVEPRGTHSSRPSLDARPPMPGRRPSLASSMRSFQNSDAGSVSSKPSFDAAQFEMVGPRTIPTAPIIDPSKPGMF